jgi:hypothetical protein
VEKGESVRLPVLVRGATRGDRGNREPVPHCSDRRRRCGGRERGGGQPRPRCAAGERANADLKNWRILRKIRSSPAHAGLLVNTVQAIILNS